MIYAAIILELSVVKRYFAWTINKGLRPSNQDTCYTQLWFNLLELLHHDVDLIDNSTSCGMFVYLPASSSCPMRRWTCGATCWASCSSSCWGLTTWPPSSRPSEHPGKTSSSTASASSASRWTNETRGLALLTYHNELLQSVLASPWCVGLQAQCAGISSSGLCKATG